MKKTALFFFLFLVFTVSAFAETQIKAELDKTGISTDEMLTYKLIITSSEKVLPAPKVPEFLGFEVISQAQSSTVSFLGKGAKSIIVYVFILAPDSAGKIKIPPSSIKVKGREYSTDSFEIEVSQGSNKEAPRGKEGREPLTGIPAQEEEPKFTL